MTKEQLIELKEKLAKLSEEEKKQRDQYLRQLATGEIQGPPTGYASIDKPWLKYYEESALTYETPSKKIYDCIYDENKDFPNDIALEYYGRKITYQELFDNVESLAKAFKHNGVMENDIVTVGMLTTPEAIYTMLALNKIGAIPSMIDPRSSVKGIQKYLRDNGSDLVIITDLFKSKFKKAMENTPVKQVITSSVLDSVQKWPFNNDKLYKIYEHIGGNESQFDREGFIKYVDYVHSGKNYKGPTTSKYIEGKPAIIVHSGGTTGFPKAVVMSDKNVLSSVYQGINSGIKFERNESWLGIMPLFIIYGASTGTLLPLIKGITLNLIPLFSPKKLPKILKNKKPTHMTLAPSHFENLINSKRLANEDLSYIVAPTVGGDKMDIGLEKKSNEWLQKHGCEYRVAKGYGSSETCSGVTINVSNECNELGSAGIPLPKTTVSVFDVDTGVELPYNCSGEICITGPTTMIEYLNSKEDSEMVLKKHADGKVWVHSGDYGYINEDGMLYVTDRIKRIIINYGGVKVLPSYVESIVKKHPSIKDCVVLGMPDKKHAQGEVPVACVVLNDKNDNQTAIAEISTLCKEELKDDFSRPTEYIVLDEIPYKATNGKVDIEELKHRISKKKENIKTKTLFGKTKN